MKATTASIIAMLCCSISIAQINPETIWTWMKGDNTINQSGSYGALGVEKNTNKPGARNYSTTWKDNNGNLWLFGGSGYGSTSSGYLNDLWKYSISTNQWTWAKGDKSTNQLSVYGTQGVANTSNKPGAIYSGISWVDASNNLWLFGGFGYNNTGLGYLNTLWKFNPSTNQWTWVNGDKTINQIGVYGSKGVADNNNKPGARYGSQSWVDSNGELWLFGGYGYNGSTSGILNDIWKFSPSTNQWTWINGENAVEQVGNYGTKGVAAPSNQPGARYVSTSWIDSNNNLWLFGGYGYDEVTSGILNDIWKYSPSTNQWTWVNGNKLVDQRGVYGTMGMPNVLNKPGGSYVSNSWKDLNGNFLLFGGYGYDETNVGYRNDLWKYNPVNNIWTWIKGDNTINQVGVYGTQGMPSPMNKSGARNGSVSWKDGLGDLWLFGGIGYDGSSSGKLNDLWKIYSMQGVLPIHLLQFNGVLKNESASLLWQAEQETNFSHYVIQRSFDGIKFDSIGSKYVVGNNSKNEYSYQDFEIRNRTEQQLFYRLQLMDKNGKFTYSSIIKFNKKINATELSVYPNPASDYISLSYNQAVNGKVQIRIVSINGIVVKNHITELPVGKASINLTINDLHPGVYILNVSNDAGISQLSFIKN